VARLELTKDLLTGIDEVDEQHRAMYAWASRILDDAPDQPADTPTTALAFLAGYIEYHFAAEEFAMELFDYPERLAHRIQHDGLRREFQAIRNAVEAVGLTPELSARLRELFQGWLSKHIQDADRRFAQHLAVEAREPDEPGLPEPDTLRKAGIDLPSDLDLRSVHVVSVPGLVSDAEVRARRKVR